MKKETFKDKSGNTYSYENYKGIHILSLSGSDYDLGFQHGTVLKSQIKDGVIPYFKNYNEILLKHMVGRFSGKLIATILKYTVVRSIQSKFTKSVKDCLHGLADGSGFSKSYMRDAFTMPDTFLWMASKSNLLGKYPVAPRFNMPTLGCTSAISKGNSSLNKNFLHGRNLDFPGVGIWEKEQAVIFYHPKNTQKYVSISTAGIPFGGFTAMNESGLTLAVHQHASFESVKLGGSAIGIIGDDIMRYAHNINDAKKILDASKSIGGFTYIIGSSKESKILCYELASGRRASHIIDSDIFGYTNTYIDKDLAKTERYIYPSQNRSSAARFGAATKMLAENKGGITPQHIAEILGEKCNDSCRISESIAMLVTISSTIFDPDNDLLYVAYGNAPVSNGHYIPISFSTESVVENTEELDGSVNQDKISLEAFDKYREAYIAYFNENNIDKAQEFLKQASLLDPNESLYHYIYGLLCIDEKDFTTAIEQFTKSLNIGHHHQERIASMYLWRARSYDMLGKRLDAKNDYTQALSGTEACAKAAKNGLKSKWKYQQPNIEFNFADVIIR